MEAVPCVELGVLQFSMGFRIAQNLSAGRQSQDFLVVFKSVLTKKGLAAPNSLITAETARHSNNISFFCEIINTSGLSNATRKRCNKGTS
jgi:hypothetical protein